MQVTLTPSFWKSGHLRNGELLLEAKYGITNRFQVGAAFPYRALRNEEGDRHHGVGDVQLSVLYNLLPGNDPFALSTSLEVEFPTGDEDADLGEGEVGWEPTLIAAKAFGKAQVHVNIGGELTRRESNLVYNIAGVYPLWKKFAPTLELNGLAAEEGNRLYVTPGVYYRAGEEAELGVGVPTGVSHHAATYGIIVKLTFEF